MERPLKFCFQELECHFTWNIRSIVGHKNIDLKLAEKSEEISGKPMISLLLNVTSAYEMFLNKDSGAIEKLNMSIFMWSNNDDPFILKYKEAFRHILFSVKLFFIKDTSSQNVIQEVLNLIPPVTILPQEQRVAITAFKAHVFSEYGPDGTKHALTLAREAVEGNPDEGEWYFLIGKMLSRIRHFYMDRHVSEEELQSFRTAHAKCKSAGSAVFLAQTTCELARYLFLKAGRICNGNDGRIIRKYNEQAYNLFKEALKLNDNRCTHVNFRCANGLRLLPNEFRDKALALQLIESTLERAPTNVYGNYVACAIYQSLNQPEKAIKHAQIAEKGGSYGCAMKIFNINIELRNDFEVEKELEILIQKFPEEMHITQTYLAGLAYFIFKKYDIYTALKYFFILADMNLVLERFNFYVQWARDAVDLCYVVHNEVKCAIEGKKARSAKQQSMLRRAITCINSQYPTVTEGKIRTTLVKDILARYAFKKPSRDRNYSNKTGRNINRYKKSSYNNNNNNNNNNSNKKYNNNNYKVPEKQEKNEKKIEQREKKWDFQKKHRSRSASVCSNKSESSTSSITSTRIYKRTRRNSKEASVLSIVIKDLEVENHLESIKKGQETAVTSLRPETDKATVSANTAPEMVLGKPSFSLGCKGWGTRVKEDKMLLLNKMLSETNLNYSQQPKSPQGINRKPYNSRSHDSLDFDKTRCTTSSSNYRMPNYQSHNKNQTSKLLGDKEKQFSSSQYYSTNSSNRSNYNNRFNSFNKNEGQKPDYTNNSGKRYNNRGNFNGNRYDRNSPSTNSPQKIIRKPFNLRSSRESLDSDDSELCSLSQNFDRLSTSSVESDYVRGTKKSTFTWNN